MPRCEWEEDEFPAKEFIPYRGRILLHKTAVPMHLTNGELPSGLVDVEIPAGPRGDVDVAPDVFEGDIP